MKKLKRVLALLLFCFICVSEIQTHAENIIQPEAEKNQGNEPFVEDSVGWRKEKAKELELEDWIDEEGYLLDSFYENKNDEELETMGIHGLIRSVTEEELDAYVERLNAGIGLYQVTRYQKIQEGYDITGIFEVDGYLAFCVQHDKTTPPAGSATSGAVEVTNDKLRKVLYYGYNGPAAAGYSYVQTAMAASEANGVAAGNTGRRVMGELESKASPPGGFKVWKVQTNGGSTQDLAFYTLEKKGTVKLEKLSGNTTFTDGNNCYSREGAVYGVYSNSSCTVKEASLTTDGNGESNEAELEAGIYYVKEMTPPKGYGISNEVKSIEIQGGQQAKIQMTDYPQAAVIDVLLRKVDMETLNARPQSGAEFSNAQFSVKYYKGSYGEGVNPENLGRTAERTWIFKTDEKGIVRLSENYKVSGDALWKNSAGNAVMPLGTITIREIRSPEGYHLNQDVFVKRIAGSGTGEKLYTYEEVQVMEKIRKVDLVKRQEGTDIRIPKAEFEHVCPDGTKECVRTDSEGRITIRGLHRGIHKIKEISVMDGYTLNGNTIEFEIGEDNSITNRSMIEPSKGKVSLAVTKDGNLSADIEDLLSPFSLAIHKRNDKGKKLADAEFTLYEDEQCTKESAKGHTNEEGILVFSNLKVNKNYYLRETKAPSGYRLPADLFGNPVVHEIHAESTPVQDEFAVYVNGQSDGVVTLGGTKASREAHINIENKVGFKLPETGSGKRIPILMLGGALSVLSVVGYRKKKRRKKMIYAAVLFTIMATVGSPQKAEAKEDASITIQGNSGQSIKGKNFQVYRLFQAENAVGMESIDYKVNPVFKEALQEVIGKRLFKKPETVTEYELVDYMQTLNSNPAEGAAASLKEEGRYSKYRYFVEELRDEFVKRNLAGNIVHVTETNADNAFVLEGLEYGYYMIDEVTAISGTHGAASLCIMNTANPNAAIRMKSDYPSLTKKIQEDDEREKVGNDGWNDIGDFEIGQRVPYKFESDIPDINGYETYYYAWHDVMDEALSFDKETVTINILKKENSLLRYELKPNEFQIKTDSKSGETFCIEVPDIKEIVDREFNQKNGAGENQYGQKVVVTYEAVLNDRAAEDTGRPGFENDVRLEFSNNPDSDGNGSTGLTPWDTVVCFTYKIHGLKVNNHNRTLEGASFRLYSDEECSREVYVKNVNGKYHVINRDSAGNSVPEEAVEMFSDKEGIFEIYGIDSGIYYLKETKAPSGYRPLLSPIVLRVKAVFPEERNHYVKGEGATDKTLQKLETAAHVQQFLSGALREEDIELPTEMSDGAANLTVINTVGKKLPVTGASAMLIFISAGIAMMTYALVKGRRENA